jgi:PEP-CTERM motif
VKNFTVCPDTARMPVPQIRGGAGTAKAAQTNFSPILNTLFFRSRQTMMKIAVLTFSLMGSAAMAATGPAVSNGSFESNLVSAGSYKYAANAVAPGNTLPTVAVGEQPASGWSFTGLSGVSENASAWSTSRLAEEGGAYAFIQTYQSGTGAISQTISLGQAVSALSISFWDVQRNMGVNNRQTLAVSLSNLSGTVLAQSTFTPGANWAQDTLSLGALAAGQYTLKFAGTGAFGSDRTAFVDAVSLTATTAVPEPGSTWLALAGVGVAGLLLSRRRSRS